MILDQLSIISGSCETEVTEVNTNDKNILLGVEMISCIKLRFCALLMVIAFYNTAAYAGEAYFEERRELALMECLNHNYQALGAYKKDDLKDYSEWWMYKLGKNNKFTPNGISAMSNFIEKNAGNFYKEVLPLKADGKLVNAIFARCMEFYKSNKLKDFLLHSNP